MTWPNVGDRVKGGPNSKHPGRHGIVLWISMDRSRVQWAVMPDRKVTNMSSKGKR